MLGLAEVAELVAGQLLGSADVMIDGVADLGSAQGTQLSFLSQPRYRQAMRATSAAAVLVPEAQDDAPCPQVICANPYLALALVAQALQPARRPSRGVAPGAHVHPDAEVDATCSVAPAAVIEAGARLGPHCEVGAGCYIGPRAELGAGCLLYPGACVLARCVLGERVILHPGAVVGSDGFGFAVDPRTGQRHKLPQLGTCILGDDVEVGANSTIDRGTFGATLIKSGTKIDNQVQIGHNVELGHDSVVVSQSGIAGSARCGDRLVMGAQGGVVGHRTLAADVTLGARAGVANDISAPGIYSGAPAVPHGRWLRAVTLLTALPELRRRLRRVEAALRRPPACS